MRILLLFLCLFSGIFTGFAQQTLQIIDAQTKEPIPYAKLVAKGIQGGYVCNYEGKIEKTSFSSSAYVRVYAAGYEDLWILWKQTGPSIGLKPKIQQLAQVDAKAEDAALYDLLFLCINTNKKYLKPEKAKAFLDVESFRNGRQVELFQAYYNAEMKGYDISDLKIKSGRYYFAPDDNLLFTSTNLSSAFCMHSIFGENEYFPDSPFRLNQRQLKKEYRLSSGGSYRAENGHTIYKINFTPREKTGRQFKGSVTLDSNSLHLYQLNYDIENALKCPFERIMRQQTLPVSMNIQKFFKISDGKSDLESVQYTTQLIFENKDRPSDTILSKSLLSLFDRGQNYPSVDFLFLKEDYHGDLRNTLLLQHTAAYWSCYSNFQKSATQKAFIDNCEVLLDQNGNYAFTDLATENKIKSRRLLESPYQIWSPHYRVRIRERQKNQRDQISASANTIPATQYELIVQVLLDFNTDCEENLHWTTKAVFDPFQSYFNFELTPQALAFINIYFDLVELARRKLEEKIASSDQKMETIQALYKQCKADIEKLKKDYCHKVERGNNMEELAKFNALVKEELGLDNMAHFRVEITD